MAKTKSEGRCSAKRMFISFDLTVAAQRKYWVYHFSEFLEQKIHNFLRNFIFPIKLDCTKNMLDLIMYAIWGFNGLNLNNCQSNMFVSAFLVIHRHVYDISY